MKYVREPSVQVGAWAAVDADSEITYHVQPDSSMIEFMLGDCNGLELSMTEDGLRRCVAIFTEALTAFEAATASLPDVPLPVDPVLSANPGADQAG